MTVNQVISYIEYHAKDGKCGLSPTQFMIVLDYMNRFDGSPPRRTQWVGDCIFGYSESYHDFDDPVYKVAVRGLLRSPRTDGVRMQTSIGPVELYVTEENT